METVQYVVFYRHSMFEVETANLDDPELVEVDMKMKARVIIVLESNYWYCHFIACRY